MAWLETLFEVVYKQKNRKISLQKWKIKGEKKFVLKKFWDEVFPKGENR